MSLVKPHGPSGKARKESEDAVSGRAEKATSWIARSLPPLLLYLLVVLVPLCFCSLLNDPFELPKTCLTLSLSAVLLLAWLLPRYRETSAPLDRGQVRFALLLSLHAAGILLGTIFSANRPSSLLGSYGSFQNALVLLLLIPVGWITARTFRDTQGARRLAHAVLWGGFVASAVALCQHFGFDPTGLPRVGVVSTLGNSNHLGAFLCMVFPVGFGLLLGERRRVRLVLLSAATSVVLLAVVYSLARAAWLGLASALMVFLLLNAKRLAPADCRTHGRRFVASLGVALLVIAVALLDPVTRSRAGEQIARLCEYHAGSGAYRVHLWETSVAGLKHRPWLGMGPDTFWRTYLLYQAPNASVWRLTEGQRVNSLPDSPHNIFLEGLLASGLIGYASYLALLALYFHRVATMLRANTDDSEFFYTSTGLAAGLVAYLVDGFFEIDVIAIKLLSWIMVGMIFGYSTDGDSPAPQTPSSVSRAEKQVNARFAVTPLPFYALRLAAAVGIVSVTLGFVCLRLKADYHYAQGEQLLARDHLEGARREVDRACRLLPWEKEYGKELVNINLMLSQDGEPSEGVSRALSVARRLVRLYPEDGFLRGDLARCYLMDRSRHQQRSFDSAIDHLREAVRLSPENPVFHFNLALGLAAKRTRPALEESISELERVLKMAVEADLARKHLSRAKAELKAADSSAAR
ncbi:MAG: O-antigen ligase family protein [Armatimonadetes bacterium]|nr:O-antigen ligase family protein [Armatimonadota bacterium]